MRITLLNLHRDDNTDVIVISDSDEEVDVTWHENVEVDALSDSECEQELVNYFPAASVNHLSTYIKGTPSYYNGDKDIPILENILLHKKRIYSVEDITHILLHPLLKSSKFVAKKVPMSISESVGVWRNNGVDLTRVCVMFRNSCPIEIRKLSFKDVHSANIYCVKRVYRIHATDQSLRKITAFVYGE